MADADFWHNLAGEFRALDPHGWIRADLDYIVKSGDFDHWRLVCPNRSLVVRFEALARRAGLEIDPDRTKDPLLVWLDCLRLRSGPSFDFGPYGVEYNADGSEGRHHQLMTISSVCLASSDYCVELESEVLKSARILPPQPETIPPAKMPILDTRSREERLQAFILEKHISIAAVCRAARVHKPNMHQWRNEQMGDTSVMAARIESVLSGKTPLEARGKKKG